MKRILTKFWGVAITMVLLTSLFIVAAPATPAAADPLVWQAEIIPSPVGATLTPGFVIEDMAISGDTVYAVGHNTVAPTSTNVVYKSTDGGATWALNNNATTLLGITHANLVAVAPDDPGIVVVVDTAAPAAYVSTTGGGVWSSMGTIGASTVYAVAISPAAAGTHYVALAANNGVYYFPLGAIVGTWTNAVLTAAPWTGLGSTPAFYAVAFSPNFASDYIMLGVSFNTTALNLNAASFNSHTWNTNIGYFDGYPAPVINATAITKVSLAMSPDYAGGDDTLRTSFVGLDVTATSPAHNGIIRMSNNIAQQIMATAVAINSVDYNGSVLVAGQYDTNTAYYCTNPLDVSPAVAPSRSLKRPGLDDPTGGANEKVNVKWYGEKVIATVQGPMGAFSQSIDNGLTWNDVSLMNYSLTNITDLDIAGDASKWYFAADDGTNAGVFRFDGTMWARVLNLYHITGLILRSPSASADAIYVADKGTNALFFSADAGQTRWYNRSAPGNILDVAAESADVVYVGVGTAIQKSTNQGFTWGPPSYPLQAGNIYSLYSLSTNNLVVGSSNGYVSYSTDGAATFTKIPVPISSANTMAIADKLDAGGNIYAVSAAGATVNRYVIGTDVVFRSIGAPAGPTSAVATGIALAKGALYVSVASSGNSTILRNTLPGLFDAPTTAMFWDAPATVAAYTLYAPGLAFSQAPWALKTSTASVKLWAINTVGADAVMSFEDTLVDLAPTVTAPDDKALIPINPANNTAQPVVFSWTRPSQATGYMVLVGLDPFVTQGVQVGFITSSGPSVTLVGAAPTFALVPGTTYYWEVKASAPIGSALSVVRSFTIEPMPEAVPVIEAPANGATLTTSSPVFSWSPVTGATSYDFQISELPGFETTVFTDTTSAAAEALPVTIKLDTGKTYFWRVRAAAPVQGGYSVVGTFTIAPPPTSTSTSVAPPVTITQTSVTVTIPQPTTTIITLPTTTPPAQIAPAYIWAIIIIGAVLVIAVIVLIVRTRRSV